MLLYLNFITSNIYITLFGLTLLFNVASLNPDIRNVSVYCKVETLPQETQSRVGGILPFEFLPVVINAHGKLAYRNFTRRKFCTQDFYPRNFARRNSTGRKFAGSSPVQSTFFIIILFYLFWTSVMHWYAKFLRADFLFWITGRFPTCKIPAGKIPTGRFPRAYFHGQISGVLIFCGQNSCMLNSYGYTSK